MKTILAVLLAAAFISCNNNEKELLAFEEMDKGFMSANAVIDGANKKIFAEFESKLQDFKSAYKAAIWKPKADSAAMMADSLSIFLEDLKTQIRTEAGQKEVKSEFKKDDFSAIEKIMLSQKQGDELFYRLSSYKTGLLNLDPSIKNEFEKTLPLAIENSKNVDFARLWAVKKFSGLPLIASIAYLSKVENDVKICENLIVEYLIRKSNVVFCGYDDYHIFVGQNSQILTPSQNLRITAGVGAFSRAVEPKVFVNGIQIAMNSKGYAEYTTKVRKPGKYTKTIRVDFVKPDGTSAFMTKRIEYEVTDCGSPTNN